MRCSGPCGRDRQVTMQIFRKVLVLPDMSLLAVYTHVRICNASSSFSNWPRGMTVSILDAEPSTRGPNPREAFSTFSPPMFLIARSSSYADRMGHEKTRALRQPATWSQMCAPLVLPVLLRGSDSGPDQGRCVYHFWCRCFCGAMF